MSASLEITRGDDELVNFLIKDPNGLGADPNDSTTWPPVDLTGCSLWFYVKVSSANPDSEALVAKGPSSIVVDPDQVTNKGEATLTLAPADTASIARAYLDRNLRYEVQLKDSATKISTVARGTIVINSDYIRTTT